MSLRAAHAAPLSIFLLHGMRGGRFLGALMILAVLWPAPVFADWFVMPFVSVTFGGDTSLIDLEQAADDTKVGYGAAVSWLGAGVLGVEVDFGYSPGFFEGDASPPQVISSRVLTLMGNVVVAAPLSWTNQSLRPYVSGGLGAMRASSRDAFDVFRVDSTMFALNAGGGVVGMITDRTGVRWELRYFKNVRGSEGTSDVGFGTPQLRFWRVSMALVRKY